MIAQIVREHLDDCEDRALIVVNEENRILYNNQFALSLTSLRG